MKCPFCKEEMSAGQLASGRYISWKEQPEAGRGQEYLLAKSYMGGAKLAGWLCPQCRRIVLDIPENPNG